VQCEGHVVARQAPPIIPRRGLILLITGIADSHYCTTVGWSPRRCSSSSLVSRPPTPSPKSLHPPDWTLHTAARLDCIHPERVVLLATPVPTSGRDPFRTAQPRILSMSALADTAPSSPPADAAAPHPTTPRLLVHQAPRAPASRPLSAPALRIPRPGSLLVLPQQADTRCAHALLTTEKICQSWQTGDDSAKA
jgi:hypothetical protein